MASFWPEWIVQMRVTGFDTRTAPVPERRLEIRTLRPSATLWTPRPRQTNLSVVPRATVIDRGEKKLSLTRIVLVAEVPATGPEMAIDEAGTAATAVAARAVAKAILRRIVRR